MPWLSPVSSNNADEFFKQEFESVSPTHASGSSSGVIGDQLDFRLWKAASTATASQSSIEHIIQNFPDSKPSQSIERLYCDVVLFALFASNKNTCMWQLRNIAEPIHQKFKLGLPGEACRAMLEHLISKICASVCASDNETGQHAWLGILQYLSHSLDVHFTMSDCHTVLRHVFQTALKQLHRCKRWADILTNLIDLFDSTLPPGEVQHLLSTALKVVTNDSIKEPERNQYSKVLKLISKLLNESMYPPELKAAVEDILSKAIIVPMNSMDREHWLRLAIRLRKYFNVTADGEKTEQAVRLVLQNIVTSSQNAEEKNYWLRALQQMTRIVDPSLFSTEIHNSIMTVLQTTLRPGVCADHQYRSLSTLRDFLQFPVVAVPPDQIEDLLSRALEMTIRSIIDSSDQCRWLGVLQELRYLFKCSLQNMHSPELSDYVVDKILFFSEDLFERNHWIFVLTKLAQLGYAQVTADKFYETLQTALWMAIYNSVDDVFQRHHWLSVVRELSQVCESVLVENYI